MRACPSKIEFEKSLPMARTGDIAARRMAIVISRMLLSSTPLTTASVTGSTAPPTSIGSRHQERAGTCELHLEVGEHHNGRVRLLDHGRPPHAVPRLHRRAGVYRARLVFGEPWKEHRPLTAQRV